MSKSKLTLFNVGEFRLNSGMISNFKIDCDALTSDDIEAIAFLISKRFRFSHVVGVPTGGDRLASALIKYRDFNSDQCLLVDDVLTTGKSMEKAKTLVDGLNVQGVVIFARAKCPVWVTPLFQLWYA